MACTAIKIGDVRIKIITTPVSFPNTEGVIRNFTDVQLYKCDDDFIPEGSASRSIHEDDEETYHKNLRKESFERGHFVKEESTDIEWNPDYKPEENESTLQSDMLG